MTMYQGRAGAKALAREAKPGMRVHVINYGSGILAENTYTTYVCTHYNSFWGSWMFAPYSDRWGVPVTKGSIKAADMVLYNNDYCSTVPPRGLREQSAAAAQVAGPLPSGEEFDRRLDPQEIKAIEHAVEEANERLFAAKKKAKGGRWW